MRRFFALFLAFSLILCSCAETEMGADYERDLSSDIPEAKEPSRPAKNDVFGVAFCKNESADPYTTDNKINFELMGLISEPLFALSDTFEVTPVLCSSYETNGRIWTFTIKSGVTFSDGSPLTADDVKASILAAMEAGSYYATRLSAIESVSSNKRAETVTVTLKYDNSRFLSLLDFPIVKSGTRTAHIPIGTGIYAPDENMTRLVAVENHHSRKKPLYETITLFDVGTSDELLFGFDSLDVSVYTTDPTGANAKLPKVSSDLISVPTTSLHYIGFNKENEKLSDKNVRRLIACAIDRKSIAQSDFALMGVASALPVHPKSAVFSDEYAKILEYNSESKIDLGIPLTILVNNENGAKLAACTRIAENLTKAGTPTTVRALPFDEYLSALQSGDFTLYYAEVSLGADFDITREISGSLNFGGGGDATMTSALMSYLGGDEGLDAYFATFCDVVPFAPIFFKSTAMYTQKNFFKNAYPSSQNIYHDFCDWKLGG